MTTTETHRTPQEIQPSPEIYERPISIETHESPRLELAMTSVGKREPNEDTMLFDKTEEMAVVFDGVGGAAKGDLASKLARDNLVSAHQVMRADVQKMSPEAQHALWQRVLEGNSNVEPIDLIQSPEDAQQEAADPKIRARNEKRREISKKIFEKDAAAARAHMDSTPDEVKREAMAIYRALDVLSTALDQQAEQNPETKGMATTATGIRMIETDDGERYGIFFDVGDSEAWIYKAKTGKIERATKTDNALEAAVESGIITPERANDIFDPSIRKAKFKDVTQALGSAKAITPHVMIWKLETGDRFLLASDGLIDNDPTKKFQKVLADDSLTHSERTEKITRIAFAGITERNALPTVEEQRLSPMKGEDDITTISGEVKAPEFIKKWNQFLDQEIASAGLNGNQATKIREAINDARGIIAREARETAEAHGETRPEIITELLRERVKEKINELNKS